MPEPVPPRYDGPGVASIIPALLGAVDAAWLPAPVHDARSVVLLVVDGLGFEALDAHGSALPQIRALEGSRVTTVVPSTTASALTSITTGLAPSEHGLVGYRMRIDGVVLNAVGGSRGRKPPDPSTVQWHSPFRGRPIPVVTKSEFERSGFTEAHLRGGRFRGWRASSSLVEQCRLLVAAAEPLIRGPPRRRRGRPRSRTARRLLRVAVRVRRSARR